MLGLALLVGFGLWQGRSQKALGSRMADRRKATRARLGAAEPGGLPEYLRRPSEPANRRGSRPTSTFRGFRPAKSGNGFTRSLDVDGWWTNCWVGRTRGGLRAKVFAPSKNGIQVQDAPLMERDCNSEEEAFTWLRDAEASGQIRREALRAIRRFDGFESDDDDIPF